MAWLLIVSTGVIMSVTVTPLGRGGGSDSRWVRSCDLSRIELAPIARLARPSDELGNILMFIPLGIAIAYVPWSTRKAAVLAGALALPFLIESAQYVVAPLRRACQSADVVDNLTGLVLGLAAGAVVARLQQAVSARKTPICQS